MWSRKDFDALNANVPFAVVVDWNARPSALKYGHVNSLLAMICVLNDHKGTFLDSNANVVNLDPTNCRPHMREAVWSDSKPGRESCFLGGMTIIQNVHTSMLTSIMKLRFLM